MVRSINQPSFGGTFDIEPSRRLFFATAPDHGAKARLKQLTERLRHDGVMLGGPVDWDRWHITLNSLGDFGDQMPPALTPSARAAADAVEARPFEVTFNRIVGAGSGLLLLASDEAFALKDFRRSLAEALIGVGLRRHVKPSFNPHLTLSYGFSDTPEMSVKPITWTVENFVLIESLLGAHRHLELGRWSI